MLSEHGQGRHLYDGWTRILWQKEQKEIQHIHAAKLLAITTNKAQKYFSCVTITMSM
jgi:hypothetical protein